MRPPSIRWSTRCTTAITGGVTMTVIVTAIVSVTVTVIIITVSIAGGTVVTCIAAGGKSVKYPHQGNGPGAAALGSFLLCRARAASLLRRAPAASAWLAAPEQICAAP